MVVIFNLAIARPLLDLLGKNPEFFIAHDWSGRDAVFLGVFLSLGLPVVLGLGAWVVTRVSIIGTWLHHLIFAALGAALALQVLKAVDLIENGTLVVLLAVVAGVSITFWFRRSASFRSFLRMGLFVPLLVLGVFLFGSRASDLISPTSADGVQSLDVTDPAPIVMVVMDELPLASLMDRSGHIDERLFPNFARVADDFTWFRDTTAVHNMTVQAIPALLDGRYPERGTLPTVAEHPANLFTLLGPLYELDVIEPVTDLCPHASCRRIGAHVSFATRWNDVLDDLRIVLGHILLPADLADSLPPIDENWRGFGGRSFNELLTRQVSDFEAFLGTLRVGTQPTLSFLHLLLPHSPWHFLPSGVRYPETAPLAGFIERDNGSRGWVDEAWPVAQAYQRHLLQVGFVDGLLGRVMEKLRSEGIYDDALIVVTSDHGASFEPGLKKRSVTPDTLGDIASVPLFVKLPDQGTGTIEDRPAQTIDVLATILDAVGAPLSDGLDGRSLLAPFTGDVVRTVATKGGTLEIDTGFDGARAAALVKYDMFDLADGIGGLFRLAPPGTEALIGTRVERSASSERFQGAARISEASLYDDVDTAGGVVPAMVAGTITATSDTIRWPIRIAVGIRGQIWAVTETFGRIGGSADFYALVPPEAFVDGSNQVELFVVGGQGSTGVLTPLEIEG